MATTHNYSGTVNAKYVIQGVNSSGSPLYIEIGKNDERTYILEWLCNLIDAWDHHKDVSQRQALDERTCAWLFSSDDLAAVTFRQWKDASTSADKCLWAYGYPGIGKTVVAYKIIEHLLQHKNRSEEKEDIGICWIYIGMAKALDMHQLPGAVLRSMLRTLAQGRSDLPQLVKDLCEKHTRCQNTSPTDDEVAECLFKLCETQYSQVYVIADGLDEASDRDRNVLIGYLKLLPNNTKVMILSRYSDAIKASITANLVITIHAHDQDARLFVKQQLQHNPRLNALVEATRVEHTDIVEKIEQAMIERAKYSFLNAQLCMSILSSQSKTSQTLRKALEELPISPKEVYQAMFRRIKQGSDEADCLWAKKILTWACFSFEPLAPEELQYITGLDLENPCLEHDNRLLLSDITRLCAGLVVVHAATKKVALAHIEAQQHLKQHEMSYLPEAHLDIARLCLAHIYAVAKGSSGSEKHVREYGFLTRYAVKYMAKHIDLHLQNFQSGYHSYENRRFTSESLAYDGRVSYTSYVVQRRKDLNARTVDLLESTVGLLRSKDCLEVILLMLVDTGMCSTRATYNATPLHVAVACGLFDAVKRLVCDKKLLDQEDGSGATALSIAIKSKHLEIAKFLVQQGCSIDLRHDNGRSVFELAVHKDYTKIAANMLEFAIKTGKKTITGKVKSRIIRLLSAAFVGNGDATGKLCQSHLELVADPASTTALLVATDLGHYDVVEVLLRYGVDVGGRDLEKRTALHRAALRNNTKMVSLLIRYNADVNAVDTNGLTPWTAVVSSPDHGAVLALLIKKDINVNVTDGNGVSVLYCAAAGGHTHSVRRMLEMKTDPSIATKYYWTPLHWAACNGHYDTTELLLEYGANVNAVSDTAKTPLELTLGGHDATPGGTDHMTRMLRSILGHSQPHMLDDIENSIVIAYNTNEKCLSCGKAMVESSIAFSCEPCEYWNCDLCFLDERWCPSLVHPLVFGWFNKETGQHGTIQVNGTQRDNIKSQMVAMLLRKNGARTSDEVRRALETTFNVEISQYHFRILAGTGLIAKGDRLEPDEALDLVEYLKRHALHRGSRTPRRYGGDNTRAPFDLDHLGGEPGGLLAAEDIARCLRELGYSMNADEAILQELEAANITQEQLIAAFADAYDDELSDEEESA